MNPPSWNGYGYVNNSPLINVDPDGMQSLGLSNVPKAGSGFGFSIGLSIGQGVTTPGIPYFSPYANYSSFDVTWKALQQKLKALEGWMPALKDARTIGNTGIQVTSGPSSSEEVPPPPIMAAQASIFPQKTGNPTFSQNDGLPKQTTNLFTIPGTHYCGPGGAGVPTDRVDAGCAAHDLCYERAGVSWRNNVGLATTTPQQRAAIKACDAALSNTLMHIYWPTSAEMGQGTIVSTYFNLPSGYSLR
jgi:hypothetical protein